MRGAAVTKLFLPRTKTKIKQRTRKRTFARSHAEDSAILYRSSRHDHEPPFYRYAICTFPNNVVRARDMGKKGNTKILLKMQNIFLLSLCPCSACPVPIVRTSIQYIGMSVAFNFLITLLFPLFLFPNSERCGPFASCSGYRSSILIFNVWVFVIPFCRVSTFVAVEMAKPGVEYIRPLCDEQIYVYKLFDTLIQTLTHTHTYTTLPTWVAQLSRAHSAKSIESIRNVFDM